MKKYTLTIATLAVIVQLLLVFNGHAQTTSPSYAWAKGITAGNTGLAYHTGMDKAANLDRIVQIGHFIDTLVTGADTLYDGGMYINYSDTNGVVLWTKKEGLASNYYGCPITLDVEMQSNGDIVILGTFCNTSTITIGSQSIAAGNGYFIAKYDSSGVFQWVNTYSLTRFSFNYGTLEVSNDATGNPNEIYVAFSYGDSVVLNTATVTGPSIYGNAVFFALDDSGNELWVKNLPGTIVIPNDILHVPSSNLYLLVDYQSLTTPIGTYSGNSSNSAIIDFAAIDGSFKAVKPIADSLVTSGFRLTGTSLAFIQPLSKIAVCGMVSGTLATVGIGNDTISTGSLMSNLWVAQIDTNLSSATFDWARSIKVSNYSYAYDVIGHGSNIVVAASTQGGGAHFAGDSIGAGFFMASYNGTGTELWSLYQPTIPYSFYASKLVLKPNNTYTGGSIYAGGELSFELAFGNDTIFGRPSSGPGDTSSRAAYLAKAVPPNNCIGFTAVAGDTLISCQTPQQLVATHSLHGSASYSTLWSPAQYLDSTNSTMVNVVEHVDLETFTFTVTDSVTGCVYKDSVVVGVYLPHFDTLYTCNGSMVTLDMGPGATIYDWQTLSPPLSQTAQTNVPGSYLGVATYTTPPAVCGSLTSIFTVIDSCFAQPDSVWPGDANSDGIADLYDVLNIGIGYNIAGPVRVNGSTAWVAQAADDWNLAFLSGLNLKHADCDGDGRIDSVDVDVVSLNYGLTHLKTLNSKRRPGNPPISVSFTVDTTTAPNTVTADIALGDMATPVADGYGVAFSLLFDNSLVDSSSIQADFNGSWLGNGGSPRSLTKNLFSQGKLDMAHTRTDHVSASGYGHLGTVSFYIQDNIIGKDLATYNFGLEVVGSKLISDDETEILLDEIGDTVVVLDEYVGVDDMQLADVQIYPNPSSGMFYLSALSADEVKVEVFSILGERVYHKQLTNRNKLHTIDLSQQANGVYLVKIQNGAGTLVKRIVKH